MLILASHEGIVGMEKAVAVLQNSGSALDAVEAGIRPVEADTGIRSVGKGGYPNCVGEVECDAAIMDGKTLCTGAVGALKGYRHAIFVARQVMERLPHVVLAGEGAARFAEEIHAEKDDLLTERAEASYRSWLQRRVSPGDQKVWPKAVLVDYAWPANNDMEPKDTIAFAAIDAEGNIAAGGSTSGWAFKYPGRLSDSGIVGAGLYADNRYGACVCTHTGEMAIRATTARSVILYMKKGASLAEACNEAIQDLRDLRGGFLGPVVIHALDRFEESYVAAFGKFKEIPNYYLWTGDSQKLRKLSPVHVPL